MEHFQIELDFPEGLATLTFEKKEEPYLAWRLAREVIPLADTLTAMGADIARSFSKTVSCSKGCGMCCRQMVPLSPLEAVIIAEAVDRLPPDGKESVLSSFAHALKTLKTAGIYDTVSNVYLAKADKKEVMDINRKYFQLGIPCPFLVEGACGIYTERPSRCREYSVLSDPRCCADPFDNAIKRLPLTVKLCETLSHAWASLTGKPPVIIPLVKALEWVTENPENRELSIYGTEQFTRAVLEFACDKANKVAQERMKG